MAAAASPRAGGAALAAVRRRLPLLLLLLLLLGVPSGVAGDGACAGGQQMDGTIKELLSKPQLEFVFVGGKGGVGKTTMSSSIAALLARQRVQLSATEHTTAAAAPATRRERLLQFYQAKAPEKLSEVDSILTKFEGRDDEMWMALEKKYGPERSGQVLLISTDPAHSLSDAFKQQFGPEPREVEGIPGLKVMEVNPDKMLKKELKSWEKIVADSNFDTLKDIAKLQQWLGSLPGIDEATALAQVLEYVEAGTYSAVIFDTAPTGHTLKLLALPDVLQEGINTIQGMSGGIWKYVEMFQGFMGDPAQQKSTSKMKQKIEKKMQSYKKSLEKVASMIKDTSKTTFIAVCIAEYLSISETQRLLGELDQNGVHSDHIIVNQLLDSQSVLNGTDYEILQHLYANVGDANSEIVQLLEKLEASAQHVNGRRAIQEKYLKMLRESPEAECKDIVEMPSLHTEVTGPAALTEFSKMLISTERPLIQRHAGHRESSRDEL